MANDVFYLIDMLYEMIDGAKGVVLSPDKCIVIRDDALELIEQLRGELPAELKKAQDLIRRRDEYVEEAKKEADRIRRQADMDAKTIVGESEIARVARDKAREMVTQANDRSKAIINVANEYTDDALRRTEEAIQMALEEIRESRARFRAVSTEVLQAQRAKLEEQGGGIVLVRDGKLVDAMPMPIAGLMSDRSGEWVAEKLERIHRAAHAHLGISGGVEPVMTLCFMSLPVIPELKLTDMGLFDVTQFAFIPVEAE